MEPRYSEATRLSRFACVFQARLRELALLGIHAGNVKKSGVFPNGCLWLESDQGLRDNGPSEGRFNATKVLFPMTWLKGIIAGLLTAITAAIVVPVGLYLYYKATGDSFDPVFAVFVVLDPIKWVVPSVGFAGGFIWELKRLKRRRPSL